jgi:hypothetical protein
MKPKQGEFLADIKAIRGSSATPSDRFAWEKNFVSRPKVDEAFPGANLKKASGPEAALAAPDGLPTTNNGQLDLSKVRSDLTKEVKKAKSNAKHLREK